MNTMHKPSHYFQEALYLSKEVEQKDNLKAGDLERLSLLADDALCMGEHAVLVARRTFGKLLSQKSIETKYLERSTAMTGALHVTPQNWTIIRLNTLLQNARKQTTGYIENTLLRLLHDFRDQGGQLPWYSRAFVVLTEHTQHTPHNVYDADNKEWKCVTNALKGVLFTDDDQFTVSLILDSIWDGKGFTEIAVIPYSDAPAYLTGRTLE